MKYRIVNPCDYREFSRLINAAAYKIYQALKNGDDPREIELSDYWEMTIIALIEYELECIKEATNNGF